MYGAIAMIQGLGRGAVMVEAHSRGATQVANLPFVSSEVGKPALP
jgi:hypothetical protein